MSKWRIIALVISAATVVIVLILWLVPVVSATHTEQVPYASTETYYETEPVVKNQAIKYRVIKSWQDDFGWLGLSLTGSGADMYVQIQNLDSANGGTFFVTFNATLSGGATATRSGSKYIGAHETANVSATYSGADVSGFTYSVTPPTKQVTEYQQVQKERAVVIIKEVKKSERVSVFKYLFD